ncbi:MAG: pyridoxine 5'-phosphate synthase [Granulosicoccus sp.]
MTTRLSVNLNAVAQLRNRRDLPWPSVVGTGRTALQAGAHGLTVHPRPDQRHTRFSDVAELRELISSEFPDCEFNVEGYPSEDFLLLVEKHLPDQVTLVPDDPSQATSDHGWDFQASHNMLSPLVHRLQGSGMRVSLFANADTEQVKWAKDTGCERIELYTGPYGATYADADEMSLELDRLSATADAAHALEMQVNAGHDLTVANLPPLVSRIPLLAEVSIGHGLTADALEFGMQATVTRFLKACGE